MASKRKTRSSDVSEKSKNKEMGKKAEKNDEESGNETSDSECSIPDEKKRRLDKKKIAAKKRTKKGSEESGSENSDGENEESKNKEKKGKHATKGKNTKESKMAKDAEKDSDSETSESDRKVRLLACQVCKKEFKLYATLVRHLKVHYPDNFACVLCKAKCEYRVGYINHMNEEHPHVDAFPCVYVGCEESFKTQKKRRDHEKSHLKYMCRFCKRGFLLKDVMQMHVQKVHY